MRSAPTRPDAPASRDIPSGNVIDLRPRRAAAGRPPRRPFWSRLLSTPRRASPNLAAVHEVPRGSSPVRPSQPRADRPLWPRGKPVVAFAGLAFVALLPFLAAGGFGPLRDWRARVVSAATGALAAVRGASDAFQASDFDAAATRLDDAAARFDSARAELDRLQGLPRTLLTNIPLAGRRFADAERLLTAGRELTASGAELTRFLGRLTAGAGATSDDVPLAGAFLKESASLTPALAKLRTALAQLAAVDGQAVPAPYRGALRALQAAQPLLDEQLRDAEQAIPVLAQLLGGDRPRELLFVFLNDAELRPGGGFVGSLALLRFADGQFRILDAPGRGPYAINDLVPHTTLPPAPLLAVAPYWTFQDANWFADGPTSSRAIARFYEQARGFAVDGVVALTPAVLERLLGLTGPLPLPNAPFVLTPDNVRAVLQEQVELNYDPAVNQPKQIIVDLIPAVLDQLRELPPARSLALLAAFDGSVRRKDLTVWLRDADLERRADELGWTGALPATAGDQFGLVEANLGGGKTSRSLKRHATLAVAVNGADVVRSITVTLEHHGDRSDRWTGVPYRGYLKVYQPLGTRLLDANGFDRLRPAETFTPPVSALPDGELQTIERSPVLDETTGVRRTEEFGRIAFGGWITLAPGETQTITLRTTTDALLELGESRAAYRLNVAKQPGATPYDLSILFSQTRPRFVSPAPGNDGAVVLTVDTDRRLAALLPVR